MKKTLNRARHPAIIAALTLVLCIAACGEAGKPAVTTATDGSRKETAPEGVEGVSIDPRLGNQVPLDAAFVDDEGKPVRLDMYADGTKPVLLSLGYYRCPMLCDLVLNGVVRGLKELDWEPGTEFEMVTVSIDPNEKPDLAAQKKVNYVREYGRSSAKTGWHFLTGDQEEIKALAEAVGFYYQYDKESNEFSHAAGVFILSPSGKVMRCLRGIEFDKQTVRLSLVEASEGKQGSTVDSLLLWCFHYDAEKGTYKVGARQVMKLAGGLILVVLLAILLPVWLRRSRRSESNANIEG